MCRCLVYYFRALRATMLFFGTSPLKKDKGQKTPAPSVGVALFPNMRDACISRDAERCESIHA